MFAPQDQSRQASSPAGAAGARQAREASAPAPGVGQPGPSAQPGRARRPRFSRTAALYLGKGMLQNVLLGFLILEAVQGVIFTVRATEGYSFDILLIFPVLMRAFAQAMSYSLPLALLFGTSLLIGRLNAEREILALRSFGFSALQLTVPSLGLGAVVFAGAYLLNSQWAPEMRFANRNAETMILDNLGYLGEGWNLTIPSPPDMNLWVRHYDGPVLEDFFAAVGQGGKSFFISKEVAKGVQSPSYGQYLFARRGLVARGKGKRTGQLVLDLEGVSLFIDQDYIESISRHYQDAESPGASSAPLPGAPAPAQGDPAPPGKTGAAGAGAPLPPGAPPAAVLQVVPTPAPENKGATGQAGPGRAGASDNFLQRAYFERIQVGIELPKRDKTVKDMRSGELVVETEDRRQRLEEARRSGDPRQTRSAEAQYWYAVTEKHRRLSLSLSTVLFPALAFLIGLAVSSANRLLPFFLASTIVPTLYFGGEMYGNYLAKEGYLPWLTQQLGNLALVGLAVVLLWRQQAKFRPLQGRARARGKS